MKIAVIGAGLAGLSAAWRLAKHHEVQLFERHAQPGFTVHSIALPGLTQRVDVPLRVFYPGYYPSLVQLYSELGVESEPVSYASSLDDGQQLYFRYRNLRLGSRSYGVMAPQDLALGSRARRIATALWRFRREATRALAHGELQGRSIGEHLQFQRYHTDFVQGFVLPALCTIATCSYAQAAEFPAEVVVDYVARGLTRQSVRRASGGADDVQQRLLAGIEQVHCAAKVEAVWWDDTAAWLQLEGAAPLRFDHIVLAAQANQARRLLRNPSTAEAAALDGFTYTPVHVITHCDTSFMPARRRDWSPVNLRVRGAFDTPQSTIWVNAVMPTSGSVSGEADVFQTVNPQAEPATATLISRARFERPLVHAQSQQALKELQGLHAQADRRLWFCGSYAQAGIPLLESAVRSAVEVVAQLERASASRGV